MLLRFIVLVHLVMTDDLIGESDHLRHSSFYAKKGKKNSHGGSEERAQTQTHVRPPETITLGCFFWLLQQCIVTPGGWSGLLTTESDAAAVAEHAEGISGSRGISGAAIFPGIHARSRD